MNKRTIPVLVALTGACALPIALSASEAAAAPFTAKALVKAVKLELGKEKSVHLVVRGTQSSAKGVEQIVVDAASRQGREEITKGKATIYLRLTPTFAYFTGNPTGLSQIFGFSAAQAKKIGKHWVSVKAGSTQYTTLRSAVIVSSVQTMLPTTERAKVSTVTVHGIRRYRLRWITAAAGSAPQLTNVMTFTMGSHILPVTDQMTASSGAESITFSRWGEKVIVPLPPKHTVLSLTKVTG